MVDYIQVDWLEARFNDVVQKLKVFLKQAGFKVCEQRCIMWYVLLEGCGHA